LSTSSAVTPPAPGRPPFRRAILASQGDPEAVVEFTAPLLLSGTVRLGGAFDGV
jgi:hypothetical protein